MTSWLRLFSQDGVPLPMVTIMIEGGMQSIDQAVSTLRKGSELAILFYNLCTYDKI